jgi:hypothetical protein
MGIDHSGFTVFVAEEFLHSSDIVAVLQEVGGESVTEGVGGNGFVYSGKLGGLAHCFLPKAYSAGWFRGYDGAAGCQ